MPIRPMLPHEAAAVVRFWREAGPDQWFAAAPIFDQTCRTRFGAMHARAATGGLSSLAEVPETALALVILTDQIPRNIHRGTAAAYATDPMARAVAEAAVAAGSDRDVEPGLRQFFYLPFAHAEDVAAQDRSLSLYRQYGDDEALGYAEHHHAIVARFGRFPHRNAILGRASTPAEVAFLSGNPFRG